MVRATLLATAAVIALAAAPAAADEGMWTLDAFPTERMKADYGWAPDQAWLDKVRGGAVRLTGGCSASFVSPQGLILTNHHCIATCLANNSSAAKDYLNDGFVSSRREDELKCAGQQAEVVTSISDVTERVKGAMGALTGEALTKARDAEIAAIEKAGCTDLATTRCQVVTLFGGGQYKLYQYRKYSDVRLAWAPEDRAAARIRQHRFEQGQEMGRFLLGSTVVLLFPRGTVAFNPQWAAARPVRLGEAMAHTPS